MRSTLTILALIVLATAGYLIINSPPPDPLALKPIAKQSGAQVSQPDGNVIWISLEGVRPDHIGAYGYRNNTTPSIDSIASDSLLFERCYAQSTETYRSAVTMLTAEYPIIYTASQQGNVGRGFRDLVNAPSSSLVTNLQNAGHTTSAVVSSRVLKSIFGFDQGFDYFDDQLKVDSNGDHRIRNSRETWETTDAWINRNFRRPFFLFVHFPNPMGPYTADNKFIDQLFDHPKYSNDQIIPASNDNDKPVNKIPAYHNIGDISPTIGEMIRMYDAEIAEVDHYIGKILHTLDQTGIRNKTMVIISSMHGESMGEHGFYFNHGGAPYHNLTHIPLLISIPNTPGARIRDVTEGINIMPTVLEYLSISPPERPGMSLLGYTVKQSLNSEYPAFSYWDNPNIFSIIRGNYELICFENKTFKLYHVLNDPQELYDLYRPDDPVVKELIRFLNIWQSKNHQRGLNTDIRDSHDSSLNRKPMSTSPFSSK